MSNAQESDYLSHVPYKISRLKDVSGQIGELQAQVDDLQEEITLDIIEGWSSGDNLFDFVMITNNGIYDEHLIEVEYRDLMKMGYSHCGCMIIITQFAKHWVDEDPYMIRNIYLAQLRPAEVHVDVNETTLGIPVERDYLLWREVIQQNRLVSATNVINSTWIEVGPLCTHAAEPGYTRGDKQGNLYVCKQSPFSFQLLPSEDLFLEHGIDEQMLKRLKKTWTKLKSPR